MQLFLREELIKIREHDQSLRQKTREITDEKELALHQKEIDHFNRVHANRLMEIIDEYGWPTFSLVGEEAACGAYLIAQHADHDPNFQQYCLNLMQSAADFDEADLKYLAYLTDRVCKNHGQPQIYGTQFSPDDDSQVSGKVTYWPILDPAHVDQRRKDVGLDALAAAESEYFKWLSASNVKHAL